MQVTVLARGTLSLRMLNNATDFAAFVSYYNDTDAASNDRIFINDGRFEDGRWTNWSRTPRDQEVSVGYFKKNTLDTPICRKSSHSVLPKTVEQMHLHNDLKDMLDQLIWNQALFHVMRKCGPSVYRAENWQEIHRQHHVIVAGKPTNFNFWIQFRQSLSQIKSRMV